MDRGRGRLMGRGRPPTDYEDSDEDEGVQPALGRGIGRGRGRGAPRVEPAEGIVPVVPVVPASPPAEYFPLMDSNTGGSESMALTEAEDRSERSLSPQSEASMAAAGRVRLTASDGRGGPGGRGIRPGEQAPPPTGMGSGRPIRAPDPETVSIASDSTVEMGRGSNPSASGTGSQGRQGAGNVPPSQLPGGSSDAVERGSTTFSRLSITTKTTGPDTAETSAAAPAATDGQAAPGDGKKAVVPIKPPPVIKKGEKGEAVNIACNFMSLKFTASNKVYEYHVDFEPEVDNTRTKRKLLDTLTDLGVRNFDGMMLFLPMLLDTHVSTYDITLDGQAPVKVIITYVKEKRAEDLVQFFNILFRKVMRALQLVELKRNYYDNVHVKMLDQHKLEIWPGHCIAIEEREGGLMLCMDASNRVLRSETVYDQMKFFKATASENFRATFTDFIVGKIVLTRYNNKCYKIDDVNWGITVSSEFERRGVKVTFQDYFKAHHAVTITDPRQPMLMSRVKPRKFDPDQSEKIVALAPELCFVTGLTDDQRGNFGLMKDLGEYTRLVPAQRKVALEKFITAVNDPKGEANKVLRDWNLEMDKEPMRFQVRNISAPKLNFGKRGDVSVAAEFNREATSSCFEPRDVSQYLVLCTQRDADKVKRFCETYKIVGQQLGIKICQNPNILPMKGYQVNDFRKAINDNLTARYQFLLVFMPQQRDDVYGLIKKVCVHEMGIPSQCVLTKTISNEKRFKSVIQKIALQINCKLGGSLWALHMPLSERIMFVGIDVCHDAKRKNASVLALVASLNNECTKYYSICQIQKVHQETGDSLEIAFSDALQTYSSENGCYPGRIIVWRDGGMAAAQSFKDHEVKQMQIAVKRHCEMAKFTFVVIQKRISQRFFKTDASGRNWNNPDPGTVIDHTVTNRSVYDFFVVSQLVRQGTVTPTHYIVIADTSDTKPDLMQKFAYATSFMYFNWPGTVRVPAMTQYAHKLAALVGNYVKAAPGQNLVKTLYYL